MSDRVYLKAIMVAATVLVTVGTAGTRARAGDDDMAALLALESARRVRTAEPTKTVRTVELYELSGSPARGPSRAPTGHTHTCANGHTWDHSVTPGHNCPECGLPQYITDPTPRMVTVGPFGAGQFSAPPTVYPLPIAGQPFGAYSITGGNGYYGAGGCANGQCDTGGGSGRRGLFGFRR